jgi:predicted short-subunit dehydrogenase-like oxidoreductase (DUF2520 family)
MREAYRRRLGPGAHPAAGYSPGAVHTSTVVIGAGRVGRTVSARLAGARLYGRGEPPELAGCRRLLIATPDAAIAGVCRALAPSLEPGCTVVHFSGATSVHALDAAPGPVACVHPLQTVWPERGPDQLEGAFAAVTGDQAAGNALARELGMTPFALADAAKPVYHAASAFASNYLVTLTQVAAGLLERAGLERQQALAALAPLQRRTIEVAGQPPTGPIARGDAGTVAAHLEAIGPGLQPLYRELGRATLPLVAPDAAAAVRDLL